MMNEVELQKFEPDLVYVDARNRITHHSREIPALGMTLRYAPTNESHANFPPSPLQPPSRKRHMRPSP